LSLAILANALILAFFTCCVVSAILQVLAWARHARDGVAISLAALWRPEGYFDETGLRQIRLARRLLILGGTAYLAYGLLILASS
jgi:hypothetical protein